jgi:deazaflavin-dependent oxidoreductase (nitroreductase family)
MAEWNTGVIEEFRANGGKVGGDFEGAPLLLLHHTGAKSGTERVTPLMWQQVGDGWAVFASKAGAPAHPDWYHNLVANPETTIEIGTERKPVTARVAEGEERDRIWEAQKERFPQFAGYEEKAPHRTIPVIVLEPR